ncbi:N-acetylglucosamine-6-phosphate deacetylase [Chryseomicrobium palamuruense]|uniref:N-acetylglucosamine-6-phosphate deacetylase n=1 Tax=Chryseomicrobium palamuruense TaxID=682973 RepID=A0ABV8UV84_9BACL
MKIFKDNAEWIDGTIACENGKIHSITPELLTGEDVIDGQGMLVVPGFVDVHIHGLYGVDTMDDDPEALLKMAAKLPTEGTTAFLATTMTADLVDVERVLKRANEIVGKMQLNGGAELLGIHVEGPFVNPDYAGAQPKEFMVIPTRTLLEKWLSYGVIRQMTVAPERVEAELIELLTSYGVTVSVGHTSAGFEVMGDAVASGVTQMTHLANAMTGLHHREIGALGYAMLSDSIFCELIVDGHHLSREMVQLLYKVLGAERILLVTDAMRAKGLADGSYDLGGQQVAVANKKATLPGGVLAGSIISMIDEVRLMRSIISAPIEHLIQMASVNPARQIGVWNRKGSLTVGKDADFLLVDDELTLYATYCRGVRL